MTLKVTQVINVWLLAVCNNSVSIFHRFRDINTCSAHKIAMALTVFQFG